jgi:hypothetical protein
MQKVVTDTKNDLYIRYTIEKSVGLAANLYKMGLS